MSAMPVVCIVTVMFEASTKGVAALTGRENFRLLLMPPG